MEYCENNTSLFHVWENRGFTHCFLDTIASIIILLWIFCFGSFEIRMYWRHGTPLNAQLKPKSKLYNLQLTAMWLLAVLPAVQLSVYSTIFKQTVYGYMILWYGGSVVMWLLAIWLVYFERNYDLPVPPSGGHGLVLLTFIAMYFVTLNLTFVNFNSPSWWFTALEETDKVKLGLFCTVYVCCLISFLVTLKAPGVASLQARAQFSYGPLQAAEEGGSRPSASQGSTFSNIWAKTKQMFPYVWPKGHFGLQMRILISLLFLIAGRVINVYVPLFSKYIVDSLQQGGNSTYVQMVSDAIHTPSTFRWDLILIFVFLRTCQGSAMSGGILNIVTQFLWLRVEQYTTRQIQVNFFEHVHNLSMRWHLSRKTGEVLRVMDRGTQSINQLLWYILFQIGPTIVDIFTSIVYFTAAFNAWFGFIVFATMMCYLVFTAYITEWRTKYRRAMNKLENEYEAKGVDSLLNFETVKYYNAEQYERNRYEEAIYKYQDAEWISSITVSMMNFVQNIIINAGFLAGSLLCAYMVVKHIDNFTVGDYVLFGTYVVQLYGPLNMLGMYYRAIQQAFVDMENMFDLLNEPIEIVDVPNAPPLSVKQGRLEFRNVSFYYVPERPILKNISFTVDSGKTVALVGASGAGKSTVMRLLFRFYDVQAGVILCDGQDIAKVQQRSLRQHIGVVPQDTVLFNDTIQYNIRYGRVDASDLEVEKAAQAAEIHNRILSFPDKYDSVVGERGLKLSGGEKQRVAIARTILKAPTFILLDEATSALDTHTERQIQASLNQICAGRTTVIIAHRLSTIIHADEILVLQEGEIVERGRHETLLAMNAVYADMWRQQLQRAEAMEILDKTAAMASKKGPSRGQSHQSVDEETIPGGESANAAKRSPLRVQSHADNETTSTTGGGGADHPPFVGGGGDTVDV